MPRAFSALAMARKVVAPLCWISRITGSTIQIKPSLRPRLAPITELVCL
jgi:hypothetical protein